MVKPNAIDCPSICYRPIEPSDLEVLEQIHGNLFPIRYVNSIVGEVHFILFYFILLCDVEIDVRVV